MILGVVYCPCRRKKEERVVSPLKYFPIVLYSYAFRCICSVTEFGLVSCWLSPAHPPLAF